ncbi:MAG: class I SAM-dependent methyltransferase [Candidatus Sungbacteria bacterium]|nr:class I SAM-dependent methyltransferase [Candidatus Sungbacteria bacterium]
MPTKKTTSRHIGPVIKCQVCGNTKLQPVLSLGHQPIPQEYLTDRLVHEMTYPLNLQFCTKCGLTQVDYIIDPEIVFPKNYPYRTGMTNMLIRNFRQLAETMDEQYHFKPKDLIIDIGSNDGSLLAQFKERGLRVLGIEPTDAAKVANKNKIPTIQAFLDLKTARAVVKKYGKARFVTATNVFAHIINMPELMASIKTVLDKDGVFVSESQYLMDIIEKLEFDTVYHEHLRFYGLKPLQYLFSQYGMSIVDAERITAAGGSIRVYAMKGKHAPSVRVKELMKKEKEAGLYDIKKLREFAADAVGAKHELLRVLIECKQTGGRIVGIGSPCRSNTLLGFAKIDEQLLDYAVERAGSPKIGMFTPGTHIPVLDEKQLFEDQPEFALMLSWHIGHELMDKLRAAGYKGKFIMPLPKPEIF